MDYQKNKRYSRQKKLTDVWNEHGVYEEKEYAILTKENMLDYKYVEKSEIEELE